MTPEDGYEGVTHAGLAILAADTGRVLLAQRQMDETDEADVQETWEWPGGHIDGDEDPFTAASREYSEEVALPLPDGEVINGWRAGPEDNYQGFVYLIDAEFDLAGFAPNEETQAVAWYSRDDIAAEENLRPEMTGGSLCMTVHGHGRRCAEQADRTQNQGRDKDQRKKQAEAHAGPIGRCG